VSNSVNLLRRFSSPKSYTSSVIEFFLYEFLNNALNADSPSKSLSIDSESVGFSFPFNIVASSA
jgi:hypothetical protein